MTNKPERLISILTKAPSDSLLELLDIVEKSKEPEAVTVESWLRQELGRRLPVIWNKLVDPHHDLALSYVKELQERELAPTEPSKPEPKLEPTPKKGYFTTDEVGEKLGITRDTVIKYIKKGLITGTKAHNKVWLVSAEDLHRALQKGLKPSRRGRPRKYMRIRIEEDRKRREQEMLAQIRAAYERIEPKPKLSSLRIKAERG